MTPYALNMNKAMFRQMRRAISIIILVAFISTSIKSPAFAQMVSDNQLPWMPKPGVRIGLSPEFIPAILKGITIHPENPLMFDFIIYKGDKVLSNHQKQEEYKKLIKYFLASLAVPDEDQWVNLSPYEKNRIIKDDFGKTLMGRDLLAQDYILKQITASLIYPEEQLGKKFWDKVYAKAQAQYGTTNVAVNTYNKVWIVPDNALIYEKGNTAYVLKNHLKVMLEEDYLSLKKHSGIEGVMPAKEGIHYKNNVHSIGSQVIREIVLPALENEVNEGKNFALLRQVYSGMLLAAWFKRTLKKSILGQIYADKAKVRGIDQDPKNNEVIYRRYLRAYKKGVFSYIKEDVDKYTNEEIPRKYFSGGSEGYANKKIDITLDDSSGTPAMVAEEGREDSAQVILNNAAMLRRNFLKTAATAAGAIGMSMMAPSLLKAGLVVPAPTDKFKLILSSYPEQLMYAEVIAELYVGRPKKFSDLLLTDNNLFNDEKLASIGKAFDVLLDSKVESEGLSPQEKSILIGSLRFVMEMFPRVFARSFLSIWKRVLDKRTWEYLHEVLDSLIFNFAVSPQEFAIGLHGEPGKKGVGELSREFFEATRKDGQTELNKRLFEPGAMADINWMVHMMAAALIIQDALDLFKNQHDFQHILFSNIILGANVVNGQSGDSITTNFDLSRSFLKEEIGNDTVYMYAIIFHELGHFFVETLRKDLKTLWKLSKRSEMCIDSIHEFTADLIFRVVLKKIVSDEKGKEIEGKLSKLDPSFVKYTGMLGNDRPDSFEKLAQRIAVKMYGVGVKPDNDFLDKTHGHTHGRLFFYTLENSGRTDWLHVLDLDSKMIQANNFNPNAGWRNFAAALENAYDNNPQSAFRKNVPGQDFAMKGGIDLNAANLAMMVKRDGKGVVLPLEQQDLAQLSNIQGLDPVILSIRPASQTPVFSQLPTTS